MQEELNQSDDNQKEVLSNKEESKTLSDQDSSSNKDIKLIVSSLLAGVIGGIFGVYLLGGSIGGAGSLDSVLQQERVVVNEDSAVIDVVEESRDSVVSIVGTKEVAESTAPNDFFFLFPFESPQQTPNSETEEQQVSVGTGFFVSSNGLIATNKHVVVDEDANYKVFTNEGKQYPAEVVARDPVNDIALLRIEGSNFPTLELGDSENIQIGQRVVAIGNALGEFRNTVTTGVVSGINRSIVATGQALRSEQIEGAIQTDAAINPGNSGGPLLDLEGRVIGINTAISSQGQLIGFAIPINDLKKDIEVYKERSEIVKPFIGVRYVMVTPSLQQERNLPVDHGALMVSGGPSQPAIVPGSPAERAGLKEGDIVLEVEGEEIGLKHSLGAAIRNLDPGETIQLLVLRDEEEMQIDLTLGERSQ